MVYEGIGTQSTDYETSKKYKGDAVYEISNTYYMKTGSWLNQYAFFPNTENPFFYRGGYNGYAYMGKFYFSYTTGGSSSSATFRSILAF